MANHDRCRAAQAKIRTAAQGYSVEEALNGLAAVAAEAIYSGGENADSRGKLLFIFGQMVGDSLKQAQKNGDLRVVTPPYVNGRPH